MKKHIVLFEKENWAGDYKQELWDVDEKRVLYSVYDLSEYPEDAIIGRNLVSGNDALDLIKLGMHYSKMGYDEIDFNYLECPENMKLDNFIENYFNNENTNNNKKNEN